MVFANYSSKCDQLKPIYVREIASRSIFSPETEQYISYFGYRIVGLLIDFCHNHFSRVKGTYNYRQMNTQNQTKKVSFQS